MTTRVFKGSLWTLVGQVLPLLVSFVATPFVIRLLGAEGFGVLVLIALIPGYLNFADFGMGMASTKFGSEAFAKGGEVEECRIVRTSALIAFVSSLPFGLGIFFFSPMIVGAFNVPEGLRTDAVLALQLASITFVVNFLNNILNTPQLIRLRMDLNTLVSAVSRIMGMIATPIVLYLGGGITGAILVLLGASCVTLAGHIIISGKLLPHLYGITIDKSAIRHLLKYGGTFAISGIAAVLLVNGEKLVLTRTTSVQTLAYYSVAFTFANTATMFSLAMGQSILPAFSQLLSPEKNDQLDALFSRAMRINIFGLLPVLTVLCVVGRPFFTIWAGEDFGRESIWPFYVLLIGLFFNLNAYIPASLLFAVGRTDIVAKLYWIQLLPYLAVTALLTIRFGAVGAATAWSLRVIIEVFVYVRLAKSLVKVRFSIKKQLLGIIAGLLILSPPVILVLMYENFSILTSIVLVICIALYGFLVWKTQIDADEKVWIRTKILPFTNRLSASH